MPKIEQTHLLTLSAFVDKLKEESSVFSARQAEEITTYNDFLKQGLNPTMFQLGCSIALFDSFNRIKRKYYKKDVDIIFTSNGGVAISVHFKNDIWSDFEYISTLADLAEHTKQNPLRFKQYPYFDNEELY